MLLQKKPTEPQPNELFRFARKRFEIATGKYVQISTSMHFASWLQMTGQTTWGLARKSRSCVEKSLVIFVSRFLDNLSTDFVIRYRFVNHAPFSHTTLIFRQNATRSEICHFLGIWIFRRNDNRWRFRLFRSLCLSVVCLRVVYCGQTVQDGSIVCIEVE